ncbi:MAG: hypothetical protein ACI9B8_003485 [Sulfitobacter sp.]|jgi:hypothetical protein
MRVVVDISFPAPNGKPWYRFAKALTDHQSAADGDAIAAD